MSATADIATADTKGHDPNASASSLSLPGNEMKRKDPTCHSMDPVRTTTPTAASAAKNLSHEEEDRMDTPVAMETQDRMNAPPKNPSTTDERTPNHQEASRHKVKSANQDATSSTTANSGGKNNSTGVSNHHTGATPATTNHFGMTPTPLSPMHPHPMQHAYYYPAAHNMNIPNSPATPSMNSNVYESILGTSLAHNSAISNMFLRQHYPMIPPLSPHTQGPSLDTNHGGNHGQYNAGATGGSSGTGAGAGTGQYGDESNFNISSMNHSLSMGAIPPASPLFPGTIPIFGGGSATGEQMIPMDSASAAAAAAASVNGRSMMGIGISQTSPSLQYLGAPPPSPVISYGGMYTSSGMPGSPEQQQQQFPSWSERSFQQHTMYPPNTPTPSPHIPPMQYQQSSQSRRTTSFDGTELLPPSALEDTGPTVYTASVPTFFSQQQPWGYNLNPPNSPYSASVAASPMTSQTTFQQQHPVRSTPRGRRGGAGSAAAAAAAAAAVPPPQGHLYYPAATPGPPIQTSHHNKGPEGANLFIFHIPNHFTNLDMWQLFCHYGTLLSVRIMVEKETGRSRGFGFVSYDSPDAAALAIKELNGFVIGNKRLKVQHKQIRPGERDHHDHFKSPPLFPEDDFHGEFHESVSGGHHSSAHDATGYDVSPKNGTSDDVIDDAGEAGHGDDGFEVTLDQNSSEGNNILRLDSIGEALQEVTK